jgi:hypothetical protein
VVTYSKKTIKQTQKTSISIVLLFTDNLWKMEAKGMSRPLKQVPKFQKGKNETEKQFLRRVEIETQGVINKSKFEDKFKVERYLMEILL